MSNEVKLTIVTDERDGVRGLRAMDQAVEESGRRFRDAGASVDQSARDIGESVRRSSDESATALTRFVDAADMADTRAMGFRDGITGVEDSMLGLSALIKGDMVQGLFLVGAGFGDLASNAANFSGPVIGNMVSRLGLARVAFAGFAGAAGIGAVLLAIKMVGDEFRKVDIDLTYAAEDFERFLRTGRETVTVRQFVDALGGDFAGLRKEIDLAKLSWYEMVLNPPDSREWQTTAEGLWIEWRNAGEVFRQLDEAMKQYIEQTGDAAGATRFLIEALGAEGYQLAISEGLLREYEAATARTVERTWDQVQAETKVAEAYERALNSLEEYADFIRGQTDPIFAWMDAEQDLREALDKKNELVKEGKAKGEEYEQVLIDIARAELDVFDATGRLVEINSSTLIPTLEALREDGYLGQQSFDLLTAAILEAEAAARGADGTRTRMYVDYYIQQHGYSPEGHGAFSARADGGSVDAFRAYLVGERGPELAVFGSSGQVISAEDLAGLVSRGGAPTTVVNNITLNMDDLHRIRDLDQFLAMLRNNSRRGLAVR